MCVSLTMPKVSNTAMNIQAPQKSSAACFFFSCDQNSNRIKGPRWSSSPQKQPSKCQTAGMYEAKSDGRYWENVLEVIWYESSSTSPESLVIQNLPLAYKGAAALWTGCFASGSRAIATSLRGRWFPGAPWHWGEELVFFKGPLLLWVI